MTAARCSLLWFAVAICCVGSAVDAARGAGPQLQILFTTQGRTARINIDGRGLRYFDFDVPNQATWQPGPVFPEGNRLIFLSMEPRRDGPGKPFDRFYPQTAKRMLSVCRAANSLRRMAMS